MSGNFDDSNRDVSNIHPDHHPQSQRQVQSQSERYTNPEEYSNYTGRNEQLVDTIDGDIHMYNNMGPTSWWRNDKIYPQQSRLHNSVLLRVFLRIVPLLLLVGGCLAAAYYYNSASQFFTGLNASNNGSVHTSSLNNGTIPVFAVNGHPTLIVNDTIGAVFVHPGPDNQISVRVNKSRWRMGPIGQLQSNEPIVQYSQQGNVVTIGVKSQSDSMHDTPHWNLNISVPASSDVRVTTGTGDIGVVSVDGQVSLSTSSGDIGMGGIRGAMILNTQEGSIHGRGLRGSMVAHTGTGDIELEHANLQGQTSLTTDSGNISIDGVIKPGGNYQIMSGNGDVELFLPESASFRQTISTDTGNVRNAFGNGATVGSEPYANLSIHTGNGNILLNSYS
jgi:Putative adhesin